MISKHYIWRCTFECSYHAGST